MKYVSFLLFLIMMVGCSEPSSETPLVLGGDKPIELRSTPGCDPGAPSGVSMISWTTGQNDQCCVTFRAHSPAYVGACFRIHHKNAWGQWLGQWDGGQIQTQTFEVCFECHSEFSISIVGCSQAAPVLTCDLFDCPC